jgi:hypothetical protein
MAASSASCVCREKKRRTRAVAVLVAVDACASAAGAEVGEWGSTEPSSCNSAAPRASPLRRFVSMQTVQDYRTDVCLVAHDRRAAVARHRASSPPLRIVASPIVMLAARRTGSGSVATSPERGSCTGTTIASFGAELVARVPVPLSGSSGPRAAARAMSARVHGGTKARETSVARIGITQVCPILGLIA